MTARAFEVTAAPPTPTSAMQAHVAACPWPQIEEALDAQGFATMAGLLTASQCRDLVALYDQPARFRSRVLMARHGYGRGEYQYFEHPLPDLVTELRMASYPHLATVANRWGERLGPARGGRQFPPTLPELHAECRAAGQTRPTPLLLKYGPDDYNCLHQDIYGDLVFPLQLTVLLSQPGAEFSGGEFVLTEQRPRRQSRVEVVPLERGDAVIFSVRQRPVAGKRGEQRVYMRHGVSRLRAGSRYTLGVIFHDAA